MGLTRQARLAEAGVTAREAEVLAAVGQRLTNQEIAARMVISVRTVESHVSMLLRKLGLPGRPALVRLAQQLPGELPLPAPAASFVGREAELARLDGLLATGPLVTLVGPAGCGKTRLALEVARRWPGRARLADLSAASQREVSAIIGAALGIGYEASDLVAAAHVALAGSSLLLVADNCEHVVAAAGELIAALARGVPGLHVLATSREPLGADGEQVAALGPLPLPAGTETGEVRASAAGRLFLDRAAAAAPGFRLDRASAPHVAAICRRLDGLPLAIELAAARAGSLDVAALAEGLRRTFAVLDRPARAGRHRSLRSAIEWSWQLLGPSDRRVLRYLAVLPGEFTLALAQAVIPDEGDADLRPALMRLVERSLVSMRLADGEPARYWLLGVIRAFVLGQPGPAADGHVPGAHARYWCGQAAAMIRIRYHPAPSAEPAAAFDEANLLAALAWAAGHDPGLTGRLLAVCGRLAETDPSRQALELIRDVGLAGPPGLSTEALACASYAVTYLSLDDAARLAEGSALAAAGERDEALACWARGWICAYRQQEERALCLLDQAISYARAAGDTWLEGSAWQARGLARANAADSFADWEHAVSRFAAAGDLTHANNVRYMLASRAVDARTRLTDVPLWLDECESYTAGRGLRLDLAHARLVRAGYELIQEHHAVARWLLEAALPVFRHAGDFRCVARTLLGLAQPPLTADPAAATGLLVDCLSAAAIASPPAMQAKALNAAITTAAAAGQLALAARFLGALEGLGQGEAGDQELARRLREPAFATFVSEGRFGGIALITALHRGGQVSGR